MSWLRQHFLSGAAMISLVMFCLILSVWLYSVLDSCVSVHRVIHGIMLVPNGYPSLDTPNIEPEKYANAVVTMRAYAATRFGLAGFEYLQGGTTTRSSTPNALFGGPPPFWVCVIPYWFLLLLTGLGPSFWLHHRFRSKRRLIRCQCRNCGYDLRATPERCPECGAGQNQMVQS